MDLKSFLKDVWQKWLKMWEMVSYYITKLLLGIMFYTVFVLYRLIAKLLRKDFLDVKIEDNVKSYWKEKEKIKEECYKQY